MVDLRGRPGGRNRCDHRAAPAENSGHRVRPSLQPALPAGRRGSQRRVHPRRHSRGYSRAATLRLWPLSRGQAQRPAAAAARPAPLDGVRPLRKLKEAGRVHPLICGLLREPPEAASGRWQHEALGPTARAGGLRASRLLPRSAGVGARGLPGQLLGAGLTVNTAEAEGRHRGPQDCTSEQKGGLSAGPRYQLQGGWGMLSS